MGELSDMMQSVMNRGWSQYWSDQIAVAMSEENAYLDAFSRMHAVQS